MTWLAVSVRLSLESWRYVPHAVDEAARRSRPAGRTTARPACADYHAGYDAAFVVDPVGNNLEAVTHTGA